jgi:UDP-N-acetylmuramate: L-alanyl-gamma-D-glutamyl-meso-diaminopimelate ligase
MNVHFIAIGGAIMHNLAICMHQMGHQVSGSDDIIFDPAKSNLAQNNILPQKIGFYEENITDDLDAVILGMHAKKDNIELLRAQEKGIKIYSFPAFIYEQAKNKTRIVVAGSHGKTTTTAMIMHVMQKMNYDFDYLVGSSLKGFDLSVKLSNSPYMIIEGDEYLASPLEMTSKFHYYQPDIAIITGIAWDHVNVFPTWESYVETFAKFLREMKKDTLAVLFAHDNTLQEISQSATCDLAFYEAPQYTIRDEKCFIQHNDQLYPLRIFGKHNLENLEAAKKVCERIGISNESFYEAMASFEGTAKRLEPITNKAQLTAFRDFAHSPSKLKASVSGVSEQFGERPLIACMELHTYSSTDKNFLKEYAQTMLDAHTAIVYMSDKAFAIKNRSHISDEEVRQTFEQDSIVVCRTPEQLSALIKDIALTDAVYLFMSSGNFDGLNLSELLNNLK